MLKSFIDKIIKYAIFAGLALFGVGAVFFAISLTQGAGFPVQLMVAGLALIIIGVIAAKVLSEADLNDC